MWAYRSLVTALGLTVTTAPAFAVSAIESVRIKASPDKIWAASAKDFCGISQFHPAVEKCELSDGGKTRTLSLKGGGTLVEKQTANTDNKSYSYMIVSGPLPVDNYKSTFSLKDKGDTTIVTWVGNFKAKGASDADARKAIDGIYKSGLDALKAKF